jgi:F1F0 ATPase subunit 2
MIDIPHLILAFLAGLALGVFFSLNLWSSVKKMTDEQTPWHVLFMNFVLRIGVVGAGFYIVMDGHWERMMAALAGFVLMREILVRKLGRSPGVSRG